MQATIPVLPDAPVLNPTAKSAKDREWLTSKGDEEGVVSLASGLKYKVIRKAEPLKVHATVLPVLCYSNQLVTASGEAYHRTPSVHHIERPPTAPCPCCKTRRTPRTTGALDASAMTGAPGGSTWCFSQRSCSPRRSNTGSLQHQLLGQSLTHAATTEAPVHWLKHLILHPSVLGAPALVHYSTS